MNTNRTSIVQKSPLIIRPLTFTLLFLNVVWAAIFDIFVAPAAALLVQKSNCFNNYTSSGYNNNNTHKTTSPNLVISKRKLGGRAARDEESANIVSTASSSLSTTTNMNVGGYISQQPPPQLLQPQNSRHKFHGGGLPSAGQKQSPLFFVETSPYNTPPYASPYTSPFSSPFSSNMNPNNSFECISLNGMIVDRTNSSHSGNYINQNNNYNNNLQCAGSNNSLNKFNNDYQWNRYHNFSNNNLDIHYKNNVGGLNNNLAKSASNQCNYPQQQPPLNYQIRQQPQQFQNYQQQRQMAVQYQPQVVPQVVPQVMHQPAPPIIQQPYGQQAPNSGGQNNMAPGCHNHVNNNQFLFYDQLMGDAENTATTPCTLPKRSKSLSKRKVLMRLFNKPNKIKGYVRYSQILAYLK